MNCCNDYGACTSGPGCAARRVSSLGRAEPAKHQVVYEVPAIKVLRCSDPSLWYAGLVGQLLPRRGWSAADGYMSNEPAGFTNFVRGADATPVQMAATRKQLDEWPAKYVAHRAIRAKGEPAKRCQSGCTRLGVCQGLPGCEVKSARQAAKAAPAAGEDAALAARETAREAVREAVWLLKTRAAFEARIAGATSPAAAAPAGQSRRLSAIETATNIAVGFVVSLAITDVVMPLFGHDVTIGQNVVITSVFTVASVVRSYALRRLFNRLQEQA